MKQKKDVCFLCQYFYPEYVSSATLPFDTAKALVENGFTVGALCGYPYEYYDKKIVLEENVDGIEIKRLKYLKMKRASKIGRIINYFSFIVKAFLRVKHLKKYKAVVVYSNPPLMPWVANVAKKRYGCKIIFVAYDLYPEIALRTNSIKSKGLIKRIMDRINKKFYPNVDKVVALSNEMKEYLVQNRNIAEEKITVIPNWYKDEYESLCQTNQTEITKNLEGKQVVSYLGNMGTCQDIDTILKVAKKMESDLRFVFLFAGHGNKVDLVKSAISQGAKNIVYYDFLHGQDYLSVLKQTSYAVVSLEKDLCGLCVPSKTYAYMMYNKPIICIMDKKTDIAEDVINSESGVVVENGEVDKIIEHLLSQNKEPNIRERYLEKYTPHVTLGKYIDMVKEVLERE